MKPVVRFAPSPTGYLHIGGARTALFNWLFARRHGGKFLLRIEDTDRERSTEASVHTILDGLSWLGLNWDGEAISQFARVPRHTEVADHLLNKGLAYRCYCTPAELEQMREAQKAKGLPIRYDGRWRDRPDVDAPKDAPFTVRLKTPQTGETGVEDRVKGKVTVENAQLDDMVLLRADGTPTYMLAVVVDDHDMGITHVIRGDDHFTNTFRQVQIYNAMGWDVPVFAHLPMILGPDGAKLSKRHGAQAVGEYREMGYLPEAVRNYLLRLCWSHGDDEIITTRQAIEWFDLEHVGASPARFDFVKLDSLNAHYLRQEDDRKLAEMIAPRIATELGCDVTLAQVDVLAAAMPDLKPRVKTLKELAEAAAFYVRRRPLPIHESAQKLLTTEAKQHLAVLAAQMKDLPDFTGAAVEALFRDYATAQGLKLGNIAQPLRAALSGMTTSPPIFAVAELLGREETLGRIADVM